MSKEGHWWCPSCKESPSPTYVTFEENHERCGHPVTWIEFKDMPPASEGVREVLEFQDVANIVLAVKDGRRSADINADWFAERVGKMLLALAALPELEKRECLACGGGEFKNITAHCKQCNGHGEVWVRKAGV